MPVAISSGEKPQTCSSNWRLDLYKPALIWLAGVRRRCMQTTCPQPALLLCSTTRPGARCCAPCTASSTAPRATCSKRSSSLMTPAKEVRVTPNLNLLLFLFPKLKLASCGLSPPKRNTAPGAGEGRGSSTRFEIILDFVDHSALKAGVTSSIWLLLHWQHGLCVC